MILIYFGLFELFDYDYLSLFVLIMCNYLIKIILNYLLFMRSNNPAQHTHTHTPFYTPNTHGYQHTHTHTLLHPQYTRIYTRTHTQGLTSSLSAGCPRPGTGAGAPMPEIVRERAGDEPATVARAGDGGTSRRQRLGRHEPAARI